MAAVQFTMTWNGRMMQIVLLAAMASRVLSLTEVKAVDGGNTEGLACEADCDNDDQCVGDLVCWQRGSDPTDIPPQCELPADWDMSLGWDICYDPNWTQTTDPTAVPSTSPTPPTSSPSTAPTEFNCADHGCPDHMVCDETSGECLRNCEVFAIDEYLEDCSAFSPSDVLARIQLIEDTLDQMLVSTDKTLSSAYAQYGNIDGANALENASGTVLSFTGKDILIAVLLIINVFTMVAMAIVFCRGTSRPIKYQAVSIDTE